MQRLSGLAAIAALLVTSAVPAAAATLPAPAASRAAIADHGWKPGDDVAERYRGYRGYRDYRHRDRIDGGDILLGAVVLGGIVAIASAASKNKNERSYPRNNGYDNRSYNAPQNSRSGDLNAAADQCAFAAEERAGDGGRVDRISTVARDGNGWRVEGTVSSNSRTEDFLCGVTDGRIDYVQLDPAR